MNFKKRLKQAICISAAVAVSFTSVYAEPTPDPEDYPDFNTVYVDPWQNEFILYLLKLGGKFPSSEVVNDYNLTSTGTVSLNVELVSATDEDGETITFSSTSDVYEKLGHGYLTSNSTSYITVPALQFKTVNTTNNYSTVSNKIECNKTGTYGNWTGNTAGTSGTITYPNYSCTFSPYESTSLASYNLNASHLGFEMSEQQITGYDSTSGSAVFNLNISTTGTISGTMEVNTVGQSNYFESSVFTSPCVDISDLQTVSSFSWQHYFRCSPKTEYILLFQPENTISNSNIMNIRWYPRNLGGNYAVTTSDDRTNLRYFSFTTGNQLDYVSIDLSPIKSAGNLYIYYFGPTKSMPNDLYRYAFGQSQLEDLTENGNNASQVAVATAAATTTELDTTSTQLHNIDTGYLDQADSAIDALDTSSVDTLLSTNDFVATANWLSTQITNFLGVNNVFSTVVYFSLVLGIILVVLGRMR